jgi:methyltransferase of ATP-grasp peptide maturase system
VEIHGEARHRARMVRGLTKDGLVTDPRWRAAFAGVPRHEFLPRYFRPTGSGSWVAVDSTDSDWLAEVYSNRVLVTQLDGDPFSWERARDAGEIRGVPTSSSSMPGIMAIMLEALDVTDDDRVLEIGTGTGYNAALLCHRLGDDRVSTVDIDSALLSLARKRLTMTGYRPTCVHADGANGYPALAPYDRVLATASVSTVPLPWLAQTRPGGLIVTTLNRPLGAGLVRITAGEGPCGHGSVLADDGRFMPLRAHRHTVDPLLVDSLVTAPGTSRPTTLSAATVVSPESPFEFFAGLELPGVTVTALPNATLLFHPDGSWARVNDDTVTQAGPRPLWDRAEAAHALWLTLDEPTRSRFGITVDPDHQALWLDTPDSPHRWPLT